jgi:NAD(P)-dependent dehydrogenase (short-subunit alcohol dehydrogenase family)
VVIADTNEAGGRDTVASIEGHGGTATFCHCDITDEQGVADVVAGVTQDGGSLDVLITSAGAWTADHQARWGFSLDLYLNGPFYACKYALEHMVQARKGAIVNIASIAGVTGALAKTIDDMGYGAAKHGVVGLTRTIAITHAQHNIRANAICPGFIRTALTESVHRSPDGGDSFIRDNQRVPLGRWGEAYEIGKVAAFLASDDASYITGQPIIVDGGIMAR